MLNTYFRYHIPKCEDLEDIIKFSTNIKTGKETIESKYSSINIDVLLVGGELYEVYYRTIIKGEKEEDFRNALSDLFKICGAPRYVSGNCNYLVDEILQQYGKRVKGGILSRIFVKTVTDNKSKH